MSCLEALSACPVCGAPIYGPRVIARGATAEIGRTCACHPARPLPARPGDYLECAVCCRRQDTIRGMEIVMGAGLVCAACRHPA